MSRRFIYSYILLIAGLFFISCQSSVRFASKESGKSPAAKYESRISTSRVHSNSVQRTLLSEAENWLGTPYKYGGKSREGTDCSGFVMSVYQSIGIALPRTAEQQFGEGINVPESEREAGDLVFFRNNKRISHVGIYVGNDEFIHASTTKGVTLGSLNDDYYRANFAGTKRVISN